MDKKIAFFDAKPYDRKSFDEVNRDFGFSLAYFDVHLNRDTAELSAGCDAVCAFVNDVIDKPVIDHLVEHNINILALRSAGYNNVDFQGGVRPFARGARAGVFSPGRGRARRGSHALLEP